MKRRLSIATHNTKQEHQHHQPEQWAVPLSKPIQQPIIDLNSTGLDEDLPGFLKKRKLSVIQPNHQLSETSAYSRYFTPSPQNTNDTSPTTNMSGHVASLGEGSPHSDCSESEEEESLADSHQLEKLDNHLRKSNTLLQDLRLIHSRTTNMNFGDANEHLSFLSKQREQIDQLQGILDEQNRQIEILDKRIRSCLGSDV
ncbi:lipase [Acrasis kona]|uniref:Lipase n=1 Tax=Acrasis kona TaxID=1008807 RepID=A0AAW2Z008_9EUKA